VREIKDDLPRASWTPAERIHLTLVFLGDVDQVSLDVLRTEVAARTLVLPAFDLRITRTGAFPPGRPARIAWVGLSEADTLTRLQGALAEACSKSLGRPFDDRPYHPHLTLARCRRPWPRHAVERWCESAVPGEGTGFEVTYVDLMRSRLTPSGPLYDRLERFPLGT
jgi:2'-5' RNA ligase